MLLNSILDILHKYRRKNWIFLRMPPVRGRELKQVDFVFCSCGECAYNRDRMCGKESISVSWTATSEFRAGRRISYPVCADYKETGEDDGTD